MQVECEGCKSVLEIEREDVRNGPLGQTCVTCPLCDSIVYLEDEDLDINLTSDNIVFPDHFFDSEGGKDISPDEIKACIKQAVKWFRKNPDAYTWTTECGNMFLMVQNYSGDENYYVVVSKRYWDSFIPYEQEDFNALESVDYKWRNYGIMSIKGRMLDDR